MRLDRPLDAGKEPDMQRQPTSLFLVAEAYRQELRADAGVIRRAPAWRLRRAVARRERDRGRRQLGGLLIRLGQRLQGDAIAPALG
jgi:ABC-type phosphonate transport system ATPase subunit